MNSRMQLVAFAVVVSISSLALANADGQSSSRRHLLQSARMAPAPAPAPSAAFCSLPNGQVINAPDSPLTASEQGLFKTIGSGIGSFLDAYFHTGRRHLLATSAPPCCPSYTVQRGDTAQSILDGNSLPSTAQYQSALTGLNGGSLTPGQSVMLPCTRILKYAASQIAPAPAPASSVAASG